jgi:hypothetical protein
MTENRKLASIPYPRDAEDLIELKRPELDRLSWDVGLRLAKAKRYRAKLAKAERPPEAQMTHLNGKISGLGGLLSVINERRGQLRRARRQALGQVPERSEAIAAAIDSILNGPLHRRVMAAAERIIQRAESDLADDHQPSSSGNMK